MKIYHWLFTLILLSQLGCSEEIEGCLDINATNFDASADVNCCCEYPSLTLRFSYRNYSTDSSNFALNTTYQDGAGQPFAFTTLRFYISNIELENSSTGASLRISDSIELTATNGEKRTVLDDFFILNSSTFQYKIGTIEQTGSFDKLRFFVGLSETVNLTDPSTLATTHPLGNQLNEMYISSSEGYIFNKIEIAKDTSNLDLVTPFYITDNDNLVSVELNINTLVERGVSKTILLNADLLKLAEGIDFINDDEATIRSKITQNTQFLFSLQ